MKILREVLEHNPLEILTEEDKSGNKKLYIKGVFLQSEIRNKNNRMYPKSILQTEVARYTKEYIDKHRAFGELNHPATPTINLDRVSHIITELKEDGNNFIGKAKILDTPNGKIAESLINEGVTLGVSSRGMGSLKETKNGLNMVQDDYRLSTAADIVADPSAPDAIVTGIMENADWIMVNDTWIPQFTESAKKYINEKVKMNKEEVYLNIFEKFMSNLSNH